MIRKFLYPEFDCENCNGMCHMYGKCECSYHGAVAPGVGPSRRVRLMRAVWKWINQPVNMRHLFIDFGHDAYALTGVKLYVSAFRRPLPVAAMEHRYRLNVALHVSRQFGFQLRTYTYPGWRDVPSVVDEFERTMLT